MLNKLRQNGFRVFDQKAGDDELSVRLVHDIYPVSVYIYAHTGVGEIYMVLEEDSDDKELGTFYYNEFDIHKVMSIVEKNHAL
jgi:hypothetical protein